MWVWNRLFSSKWRDAWEERFFGRGETRAVITSLPGGKTGRIAVYCQSEREARAIQTLFGGSVRKLKSAEWQPSAQSPPPPRTIRRRLVVCNFLGVADADSLREAEAPRPVLHIPPGLAFGTGDHATTATCLGLMLDWCKGRPPGWSMIDAGCGTGILSLAARLFGASPVHAFDFDPTAVRVARTNARLNRIRGVTFSKANLLEWSPHERADFVAANVFADALCDGMPTLAAALNPGGALLVSGILRQDWPAVETSAARHRLAFPIVKRTGKWVTALGGRRPVATARTHRRPQP